MAEERGRKRKLDNKRTGEECTCRLREEENTGRR